MGAEICESQRAGNPGRGLERNTCLSSDADNRDHNIKQIKHQQEKGKKKSRLYKENKISKIKGFSTTISKTKKGEKIGLERWLSA